MSDLTILHLYPKEMNLYGDHGNILALKRRAEWRGYQVKVIEHHLGDTIPKHVDIVFGGGGQDSGQSKIEQDLRNNAAHIKELIDQGTPGLVVCGLYQLFGEYFQTNDQQKIQGIGALRCHTIAGPTRLIGNIVISSPEFGEIVGYENHSGLTQLAKDSRPFGTVVQGAGNNGTDLTEGILYKNFIGTYLHGPILPKNPRVADFLILKALQRKDPSIKRLKALNDNVELHAHSVAANRPR
ncbi:glutamine amidotransferase [Candidatus Saccharibacteria bacterium]|nr:glutamine amidotransferase [Candidatus Saccharibacteria bacterium]